MIVTSLQPSKKRHWNRLHAEGNLARTSASTGADGRPGTAARPHDRRAHIPPLRRKARGHHLDEPLVGSTLEFEHRIPQLAPVFAQSHERPRENRRRRRDAA
ncbi:MAG: hypothetical protein FJ253_06525 [Phycisphaerae bacterium]|nr:hypothetical protein [Phycisphaerae bacterium]